MTEPKTEIQSADSAAATTSRPTANSAKPASPPAAARAKRRSALGIAFVVVLLIAVALAAGLWYQHKMFHQSQAAMLEQVQSSSAAARQAASQAQQALSLAQEQGAHINALQVALNDSRDQVASLDQAFQLLTDKGSDLLLINDVDHLVQVAHQQLILGGNVGNAIIALETAQAQLARASRPSLAGLQQSINGDLDRLRAVSTIDVAQMSSRLEELGSLIGSAPLLVPDDAAPKVDTTERDAALARQESAARAPIDPNASWWSKGLHRVGQWADEAWVMVRQDLGGLISVRRVENSSALLMSPDQAGQLRENLRLRVMTAQLALMMHQPAVWKSETGVLVQALKTHYDTTAADTRRAQKLADQLADTDIAVKLPTVSNSMQALDALRAANATAGEQADSPSSVDQLEDQPGQGAAGQNPAGPDGAAPASEPEAAPAPSVQSAQPQE